MTFLTYFDDEKWCQDNRERAMPFSDDFPVGDAEQEDTDNVNDDNDLELLDLGHEVDDGGWLMVEQGPEVPVTSYDTSTVAPAALTAQAPAAVTEDDTAAPPPEDRQSGSDILARQAYLTPPPDYNHPSDGGLPVAALQPLITPVPDPVPSPSPAESVATSAQDAARSGIPTPPWVSADAAQVSQAPTRQLEAVADSSDAGRPPAATSARKARQTRSSKQVKAPMAPPAQDTMDMGMPGPSRLGSNTPRASVAPRVSSGHAGSGVAGPSSGARPSTAGPSKKGKGKAPQSSVSTGIPTPLSVGSDAFRSLVVPRVSSGHAGSGVAGPSSSSGPSKASPSKKGKGKAPQASVSTDIPGPLRLGSDHYRPSVTPRVSSGHAGPSSEAGPSKAGPSKKGKGKAPQPSVSTGIPTPPSVGSDAFRSLVVPRVSSGHAGSGVSGPSSSSGPSEAGPSNPKKRKATQLSEPGPPLKKAKKVGQIPCTFPGCTKTFATKGTLQRHETKTNIHISPGDMKWCPNSWCTHGYARADALTRHRGTCKPPQTNESHPETDESDSETSDSDSETTESDSE
ncbi:hypothetical protein DFH11DRAFT_1877413 [Phellopilus nigrolimitatus]|nr:hypothetical protein DFH11DRAFT_1877413 [Phellopilus nigrolimitatus]